jgi:signal transduction histidine kinase
MPEMTTIASDELAHQKDRARKLAMEKSYLQLIINLMNSVSASSGLDDTVDCLLRSIIDVVGGANIALYYTIGNDIRLVDVLGRKVRLDRIDDYHVQQVFSTREPTEFEHDFSDTQMMTPEFTKAYTWIYPLLVGPELVGVLKMESLHIDMSGLHKHLPTFFNFAALALKNNRETEALHLKTAELEEEVAERLRAEETLHFQTVELEEEVAERQLAQEKLQKQAALLEDEVEKRSVAQYELEQRIQERTAMIRQQEGVNLLQQSLLRPAPFETKLADITDGIVQYFQVDFCRIWMISPGDLCEQGCVHAEVTEGPHVCRQRDKCLHLIASSGRYTHLDGKVHRRVPFGCYKIGLVASGEEHKFLTNDVENEPRIHNHEWAHNLGLVSFAGYQLRVPGGNSIGVLALFSKHPISPSEDALLDGVSSAVALTAQQAAAEEALHFQTVELEEEVAERQMAQETLQEKALQLEEEVEKRQETQYELEILNENLELRVLERTAEVQQAYDDLKRVQGQLLQQDKMASVGQLAAGVAHEINNPMGFIISNLGSLGKYVDKITAYLAADETILAGCPAEIRDMTARERQKYKIEHICRDMPALINESADGAQRVRQIVQELKNFSRIDSAEFAAANINDGLESTISIAWNELKYKSAIIKEYSQLPLVWCNLGQLNQVFLNLLVNAAHAIKEQGEIRIATLEEEGAVRIVISDTGSGIPPEHIKRIFDPFFTTKEVGKGTGLGLAIAYDIVVNKHKGKIEVNSTPGAGSSFTIILPLNREREVNESL